jgi:hypothetical protein
MASRSSLSNEKDAIGRSSNNLKSSSRSNRSKSFQSFKSPSSFPATRGRKEVGA